MNSYKFKGPDYGQNVVLKAPESPEDWVDEECCSRCGEEYRRFVPGITFADGVALVRQVNGGFESGGGWRSRGAVLWAMRVLKLDAWYMKHSCCLPEGEEELDPLPSPCVGCANPCQYASERKLLCVHDPVHDEVFC